MSRFKKNETTPSESQTASELWDRTGDMSAQDLPPAEKFLREELRDLVTRLVGPNIGRQRSDSEVGLVLEWDQERRQYIVELTSDEPFTSDGFEAVWKGYKRAYHLTPAGFIKRINGIALGRGCCPKGDCEMIISSIKKHLAQP